MRPRDIARVASSTYDLLVIGGGIGGPLLKDKLWYFATARTQGSTRVNANMFFNLNAGDPTKWLYRGGDGISDPGRLADVICWHLRLPLRDQATGS